ncbi:MAG: GTP-binding protein [Eubacteriales bacterium]|nr:GTP-binding protein [Eubacteriales bacterium]
MVKVDLITGFLGSGKTTFIKKYARYLMDQGYNIGILENDFGAVNVDMMLLRELEGEQCELEMVAGGCDKDCHRRRFKTKLIAMGMCGYDRVLIEPSGIFDMDEFFDALHEEPLDRWYQIGNVIAVVDAGLDEKMSEEADYILASEVADAGCIVLSKTQEASKKSIEDTVKHLNRALEAVHCKRKFGEDEIIQKDWEQFETEDFERILNSGYIAEDYEKMSLDEQEVFKSLYFMDLEISGEELRDAAQKIMQDPACGSVFRIKGFTQEPDGSWTELNATHHEITQCPIAEGQKVIIVIGEHLEEEEIRKYLEPDKK